MTKKKSEEETIPEIKLIDDKPFLSLENYLLQCIILFFVVLIFYGNTLQNGFALDDGLVWTDNKFVKNGFAGIFDILFHDSFYGTIGNNYNLAGGRWRPLSLITFAIENQLWGQTPWISHLINLVLYGVTGFVLLKLVRNNFLPNKPLLSFAAVLLFIMHPVHTEAITNIKSRDEILSLLFLLITLFLALDVANGKRKILAIIPASLSFYLALLSKENGLMFLFILPVTLYFFSSLSIRKIAVQSLPYFFLVGIYIALRISIVGFSNEKVTELMDNPFLLATASQRFATIFFVFLLYFKLLFFPHPLTYDYSYNQIPYRDFSDAFVILSVVIHVALIVFALMNLKQKNILAYCILFYFASIFIVSNIVFNIGAPLAERFLYQPSIVFCLALVVIVQWIFNSLKLNLSLQKNIAISSLILISIPAGWKTVTRNKVWRTGPTLGMTDVHVSNYSARANTYAAANYISLIDSLKSVSEKKAYLKKAVEYCYTSQKIYPKFYTNLMLWGFAYSRLDSLDKAVWAWKLAEELQPNSEYIKTNLKIIADKYYNIGLITGANKSYDTSIYYLRKAISVYNNNADYWYNLGGAYFTTNNLDSAEVSFSNAIKLNPNHTQSIQGLQAVQSIKNQK
ncbi:MAG: tetratricopeptide repeat protein [Bacteroidota bacterium]